MLDCHWYKINNNKEGIKSKTEPWEAPMLHAQCKNVLFILK